MNRLLLLLLLVALTLPTSAWAVNGLDSLGLTWGMSVEQVKKRHPTKHEDDLKNQPEGTVGGRLVLTKDVEMFDERLTVALYFGRSGLSIIRLQYKNPDNGDAEKLVKWYEPHWGEPLYTTERKRGRKSRTWAWAWEGVEIREVVDDGRVRYARADFSAAVADEWSRADAMLCSLLGKTTGCPFPDTTCPLQDSALADGKRELKWEFLDATGALECTYSSYQLNELRLVFDDPTEKTAKFMEQLLLRRIGKGIEDRENGSQIVTIAREWPPHGLDLRIYRKSRVQLDDGTWTGPVDRIRLKRTLSTGEAAGTTEIQPPQ